MDTLSSFVPPRKLNGHTEKLTSGEPDLDTSFAPRWSSPYNKMAQRLLGGAESPSLVLDN